MAKSKKSTKNDHRVRNVLGAAVIFVPALLAAVTAFMNTAFARDNGLTPDDLTGTSKTKGRRRSKKATA
jgi:hypothetical protein